MNIKLFSLLLASVLILSCQQHYNDVDVTTITNDPLDSATDNIDEYLNDQQQPMIVFKDTFYDAYWEEVED